MNQNLRRNPARTGRLAAAVALLLAASAQGADFNFDIPAGDLKAALDAYVKQTGQQIVYKSDDVKGKTTPGVHGSLSDQQALDALLKGTGLQLRRDDSGAVVVFPAEAVAGGASAQGAGGNQKLEEVIVTATAISQIYTTSRTVTRIDADPMLLPMSVSAVQEDLLSYQQATSVADVLANVAGVNTDGSGYSTSRGFLVTSAQNGMTTDGSYGAYTNLVPLVAMERVEVVKGPQQILQGQAAGPGGTVNVVTKVPTPDDYAYVGASAGSEGYYRFDADVNGTLVEGRYGRLMGELIGSTSSQDGPKGTPGTANDYISAGLAWTNEGSGTDVSVVYQYSDDPAGQEPVALFDGAHLHNGAKTYVLGARNSHFDTLSEQVNVQVAQRIAGTWNLNLSYLWRDISIDEYGYFPYGFEEEPQIVYADQYRGRDTGGTTNIYRIGINGQVDLGPVTNKILLAYDYQTTDEWGDGADIVGTYVNDLAAGTQDYFPYDPPFEAWGPYRTEIEQPGVLVTDQVSWGKWHALLGVRWVTFDQKFSQGKPVYDTSKLDDSQTLPQYGIVYAASPRLSLYASGIEGFRVTGTYRDADGNLLPSMSYTQYEGGAKLLMLEDQLALTVALYHLEQSDVPQRVGRLPNGQWYFRSAKGINSKGVEVELAGQPVRGLQFRTTFSYLDAEDDQTGEPPASGSGVPLRFSLWTQYWLARNPGSGWWAGGGLSAWDAPDLPKGTPTVPGATVFDLSAGYQADKWQATAGVKNVGDVQAYYTGAPYAVTDVYYQAMPIPGREYRFDVSYRF